MDLEAAALAALFVTPTSREVILSSPLFTPGAPPTTRQDRRMTPGALHDTRYVLRVSVHLSQSRHRRRRLHLRHILAPGTAR